MKGSMSVWIVLVLGCVLLAAPVAFGRSMDEPYDPENLYSSDAIMSKMDDPTDPESLYASEALWASPEHDHSIFAKVPKRAISLTNATTYDPAAFGISPEAIAWCLKQRGAVEYRQYAYIKNADVIGFGRVKAYCNFGIYTLVEVETLASSYPTLAQMAYMNPIPNFKWDKTRWGSPASQYCVEMKAATFGSMFIEDIGACVSTGWSRLPVEDSPGLSNSCEFGDGSTIEPWALLNGREDQRVAKHFRHQNKGRRC